MGSKIRRVLSGRARGLSAVALVGVTALVLAGCGGGSTSGTTTTGSGTGGASAGGTLTVDTSFILEGLDPARSVTPTLTIATKGLYDTLLATTGSDVTPKPSIAASYDASPDAKTYTFHLRDGVTFADGTKMTSADVLFSFQRLVNLKLGGSYLLDGVAVTAPDATTVVLTSKTANPALPVIVSGPSFVILNSALVKQNGGTDAADAATTDKAETWFNSNSAGSGPYVLESYKTSDSMVLVRNDKYWGSDKPKFDRVVIRNMPAATQLLNVQQGTNEIAIDLSATQSASLKSNAKVAVNTSPSSSLFRLQMNMDSSASAVSSNDHIQQAIRYGVNYDALVQLGGAGAVQAAGLVPSTIPGSLPASEAIKSDADKAKSEIAASGITSPSLTLTYPSDINVNGVTFATFAQRVQADLQAIGFQVKLEAIPATTYLTKWRTGKMEFTMTYSYPDYMDTTSMLSYLPGGSDAVRAGWPEGADPTLEAAGATMGSTVDTAQRAAQAQDIQRTLNQKSPYVPLIQTAQTIVGSANLTGLELDPSWTLDVAAVGSN
jgi:peptide/nickel transport system substrate-binding protein